MSYVFTEKGVANDDRHDYSNYNVTKYGFEGKSDGDFILYHFLFFRFTVWVNGPCGTITFFSDVWIIVWVLSVL